MNPSDVTIETFQKGFNCAQAVLSSFAPSLGLDGDTALRISNGFGGGIARQGEVCGAITGAVMVLGLKLGSSEVDSDSKARLYAAIEKLFSEFKGCHGSIICRDLLSLDLSTDEGRALAAERGVTTTICPGVIRDVVEILERVLNESSH